MTPASSALLPTYLNEQAERFHVEAMAMPVSTQAEIEKRDALFRTVIDRAYYASYHHCMDVMVAKYGFERRRSGEDHQRLREHLQKNKFRSHTKLEALRFLRNDADYDNPFINSANSNDLSLASKNALDMMRTLFKFVN